MTHRVCLGTLGGEWSPLWPPRTKVEILGGWPRCVMSSSRDTEATSGLSHTSCRKHQKWPQLLSLWLPRIHDWKQKKTFLKAGRARGLNLRRSSCTELKLQARWRVEEGSKAASSKLAELSAHETKSAESPGCLRVTQIPKGGLPSSRHAGQISIAVFSASMN